MKEIKFNLTLNFNEDATSPSKPIIINLPETIDGELAYIFDEVIIPHSQAYLQQLIDNDYTDYLYYILGNITFKDSKGSYQYFENVTYDSISEATEERTIYKNFKITYKNK